MMAEAWDGSRAAITVRLSCRHKSRRDPENVAATAAITRMRLVSTVWTRQVDMCVRSCGYTFNREVQIKPWRRQRGHLSRRFYAGSWTTATAASAESVASGKTR